MQRNTYMIIFKQHYSQQAKARSNPSVHRWMTDKQKVIYTCNRILFGLKEEENFDICYNMDEPSEHYAK